MNPYTIAFAIGYYYGRAYPRDDTPVMSDADMYHRNNKGFEDGLAAGRRDFEELDLVAAAESQDPVDTL